MNESQSAQWPSAPHYDTMQNAVAEQDLNSFFDLDGIDFDLQSFDTTGAPPPDQNASLSEPQQIPTHRVTQPGPSQEHAAFYDFSMPMYTNAPHAQPQYAFQRDQHGFMPHHAIPPTPNSLELHAGANRFIQQQQAQHHHHPQMDPQNPVVYQLRKDDAASFTPLVSPAVTPHEARFQIPNDFTITPNAVFSPLTSPALEAQRQKQRAYQNQNTPGHSGSSAATSPADGDVDMLDPPLSQNDAKPPARGSKKTTTRSSAPTPRVRQSPIVKAQRRKSKTAPKPAKEVAALLEEATRNGSRPESSGSGLDVPRSGDASEASISPEPLNESLMGPPPRPHSLSQSPNIAASRGPVVGLPKNGVMPATPATLMRLQASPDAMSPVAGGRPGRSNLGQPILEELELPEAAQRPGVTRQLSTDDASTPRVMAKKTPKLGPLSTPSAGMTFTGQSPNLSAVQSPLTPTLMSPGGSFLKKDAKARQSKKRNSTSSTLVSPALRPKISPSIKPLAPSGTSFDDTHAALLASKSNYQNILDGTHVPGVSYPEALSTNLTSKRTSHKIAEQGRRNRINTALQEMQSLLPSPVVTAKSPATGKNGIANGTPGDAKSPGSDNGKDSENKGSGAQGNSKAATVELAIDYIKKLQQEQKEHEDRLAEKDKELEELRKRMGEMQSRLQRESTSAETDD